MVEEIGVGGVVNLTKLTKVSTLLFVLLLGLWVGALRLLPKEPSNYFDEVQQWFPGTGSPIKGLSLQPTDGFLQKYGEQFYIGQTEHYRVYVDAYGGVVNYLRLNTKPDYRIYFGDLVGMWGHPDTFYRKYGKCHATWGLDRVIIMLCRQARGMGIYNLHNRVVLIRFFMELGR